ncbi:hypothetical protein BHE74_00044380 [Ensete ventricosum]|nr:hypothetical protein BHE74_00044380 [Ensete ventricosum]
MGRVRGRRTKTRERNAIALRERFQRNLVYLLGKIDDDLPGFRIQYTSEAYSDMAAMLASDPSNLTMVVIPRL